jgi:hypothetical protein
MERCLKSVRLEVMSLGVVHEWEAKSLAVYFQCPM